MRTVGERYHMLGVGWILLQFYVPSYGAIKSSAYSVLERTYSTLKFKECINSGYTKKITVISERNSHAVLHRMHEFI